MPVAVPSTLLERRPDIAAAEREVAAANAEIGVAKAAFFPSISLGASGGFQSTGGNLLSLPDSFWSIGPNLLFTLFDGGRRRAEVEVARAARDAATAQYKTQVLTAFQQVEDNLALLRQLGIESDAENRAVADAALTERASLNRYVKGASTYLDVVTAQTVALRTRETALTLRTRQLQAGVALVRALDGGWSTAQLPQFTAAGQKPGAAANAPAG